MNLIKRETLATLNRFLYPAVVLFLILAVFLPTTASALNSRTYTSTQEAQGGHIMSYDPANPRNVTLASLANKQYVLGVAASNENVSPVVGTDEDKDVVVITEGRAHVYVSDLNGSIRKGDFIGASWIEGVGMRADIDDRQRIVGVALNDFDKNNDAYEFRDIKTPSGTKTARIWHMPIQIFAKDSSVPKTDPEGLRSAFGRIAGKDVSYARLALIFVIFISCILVVSIFAIVSIRGSFTALGRNPLANKSIFKGLTRVSAVSVVTLLIGAALSYVVLLI